MRPKTRQYPTVRLCLAIFASAAVVGCQTGPRLAGLNPFYRPERTTFETPSKRVLAIRQIGKKSTGENNAEQEAIVQSLVTPLATETDPLIRQAVIETAAEFRTPLASRAVLAGLSDESSHVRESCCRLLASRRTDGAVEALAARVQGDESFDVRIAAAQALQPNGANKQQLLRLLEDPNPAMQLVGVEAMRNATGKNYGGDVSAYIALAKDETPTPGDDRQPTAVANRLPGWLPFF